MQLAQFIQRALDFFSKSEANLTAASELQNLRNEKGALEKDLAAAKALTVERDGKITELQGALEKAQGEVNAKGTEIAGLKTELEAEKARTDETLAGMGIDAKRIPIKIEDKKEKGDVIAQHDAIADPVKRMAFYRKNKAAYDAAWSEKNPPIPDKE